MTILIINGKKVSPKKGKVNKVEVKQGDSVELLDANGQPANIQAEVSGEDLIIYDENGQVEWVIAQYQNAPQLAAMIPPAGNPATEAVLASEMGNKFSTGITAVGGLLLMGGAIALSSNNGDEDDESVSIQENVKGASITNVKPDELDGNKISYTISDDRFEVNKDGTLKLKPSLALDYETEESVTVEVTAKDENGKEVTKTVKIKVEDDKSDNPNREPDLKLGKDEVSVKENIQGEKITSVKFTDPDGDSPIYEVSDNRFEVVSGSLKLKDGIALDYEKEKTITVKVTAKDGRGLQDSETIKITVLDDKSDNPNHPPTLTLSTSAVTIKENAKGANIAKVTGKDDDGDKLTYTVSDNRFEVDSKGNLKLKSGQFLDYEKEKNLTLKVTASDGKDSVSKEVKITVTNDTADDAVTPQPNNPPVLTLDKTTVSIKENVQGATITGVKATDKDGDKISYSVNDNRFEVDSKGNLKLKSGVALDYEKEKNLTVKVTANDGKNSVSKEIKITVTNDTADDAVTPQPNNAPVLTLDKTTVSIKENVQGATITGVKATDKDGDKISYSVNDNRFEVDSKGNLKLKSGQFLDYEKEKTVNLTITAKDSKGASASKTLKVNVEDVNEKPNMDLGKAEVTVKENVYGAKITNVTATDPDGDEISYTVSDTRFLVDNKGNLKLKSSTALDYEKEKNITVKVTASDGKNTASKDIKITVEDDQWENNHEPELEFLNTVRYVKENIQGAELDTLKFTDPDGDYPIFTVSDNRFEVVPSKQKLDDGLAYTVKL
ncbi:MAG: cadherin repeat domain-containing protein [Neisseriaceae bacterium]|nr:cadherin repeat domain-containing protein [Neisseriaceae bacterium]